MTKLSSDHIDYIIKDLNYRGIVADEIQDELIDHICTAVESQMNNGTRFIDAYHHALKGFGHNNGLLKTQQQILETENKTTRLMLRNYFTIAFRNLKK